MKITKSKLRQIIKEELSKTLREWDTRHEGLECCDELVPTARPDGSKIGRNDDEYVKCLEDFERNGCPEHEDPEMPMMEKKRTAKGNITQDTREKHATVGKDKFPIFDKKSAEAAIDLRGHAPAKDRAKIINKAAKYAPAAAKKAREADKK